MGIQCFLNFVDICHIYYRYMEYFFKIIKGIWDTGTSLPGPHHVIDNIMENGAFALLEQMLHFP